jgi:pimeloyl-ACP methyl ester carboxylesterase
MSIFSFTKNLKYLTFLFLLVFTVHALAQEKPEEKIKEIKEKGKEIASITVEKKGRLPVIIIPGLIGSELINKNTGDKVWFDLGRAKDDDMRLPISSKLSENHDNLVPGDILREIQLIRLTPKIDIYQKLLDSLKNDGYAEGKLDDPAENGFTDTFYVFPYDWRLDNVENAHILLEKLDILRSKTNRPDLKVNIVAHSMGGLIARYAAMYGKADLTRQRMRPTWKGASYFNNIMLVATPNGGSLSSLNSMLNGFSLFGSGKINLPFVQNLSKYDLFTIPSIYQLLPPTALVRAFNGDLKPIKVDVYNPATWEKYGWTAYTDDKFNEKFNAAEQKQAKAYFRAVLARARLFQMALDAKPTGKSPIPTFYLGSECKPTIDGMIIHKDKKQDRWKTQFEADSFTKSDGTKVTKEELEKILYSPGDGVVPKRSLISSLLTFGKLKNPESAIINDLTIVCGEHNRLTGDAIIDQSLRGVLNLPIEPLTDKSLKTVQSNKK